MKRLLFFILTILPMSAMAEAVEINGINYNLVTKDDANIAEVISRPEKYSGSIVIPETVIYNENVYNVTSIGNSAFYWCSELTSVSIPDNVTSIGSYCFAYCSNLSNVSLSNNLSALGMGAFAGCSKLESITVPGSIGILESSVFQNCTGLKSVILSEGISEIRHIAFNGCTSLRSVALPSSLGKIESAFSGCSSLESITLPKNLTTVNGSAFSGCSGLKELIIEDGESELFFSNPYTTSNIVCFSDCPLENLYIGRNIERDNNATLFVDNKTLKTVSFGENVTMINSNEFYGCENLSSLTFSKSINTISSNAFWNCKSLNKVIIPNNVTYIGSSAFSGCNSLKEVIIEDGSTELAFGTEYDNRSWCFSGPVDKLYLGRNVSCRFSPFANVQNVFEVTIGRAVTELTGGVFASLKGISKLVIEANSEPLVFDEFYYSYQNTFMPFRNTPIDSIYLDRYIVSKKHELSNQNSYAFRDVPSISFLGIGSNVDKIAKDMFFSNCNITTLIIPKNVRTVEESALMGCSSLSSVTIADGENKLEFADGNTFKDCPLQNVYIGRNIGYPSNSSPLKNHKEGIESITIGENVTEISNEEFYGLKKIASVALPQNLKTIGSMAFYGCEGLTELTIPGSVTEIGQQAFDLCRSIKTLRLDDGKEVLKFTAEPNNLNNAFQNSPLEEVYLGRNFSFTANSPLAIFETLKSMTIGEDVSSLAERSFIGCPNLKDVTSYSKVVPTTSGNVFTPSYQTNATLHVPYALYDEYKVANVWKDFGKIVNFEGLYNLVYSVDGEEYKKYVVEQGTSITPETEPTKEGYTFNGWSEIPDSMPAHDVIVTGAFSINKYKLIYNVDGEEYQSYDLDYGSSIIPEDVPIKEGYTFSGWSEIPETMPAHDVTVTGSFSINSYKLTYMLNNEVYKEMTYEYGATVTPEPQPEGDYASFEWIDLPQTMPAHDVVVYAMYTSGITDVLMKTQQNVRIYTPNGKKLNKLQKGLNIVVLKDGTVKKVVIK